MGRFRPGMNEICDRFGLDQIHSIIEKGPLTEFPRTCLAGPGPKHSPKEALQHHRAPMALHLHNVLSRERVGPRERQHEAFVERRTGFIAQARKMRLPRDKVAAPAERAANGDGLGPGNSKDPNAAHSGGRRYGRDGIGHSTLGLTPSLKLARNPPLLGNGKEVVRQPVEHQAGGEE